MVELGWQKSTYSASGSSCVCLATSHCGVLFICESDDPEVVLTTTPDRFRPLISRIKAGAFDG
ncbi:DUF397 domain-containing protein [Streptomyces gamaensis]|uniref:DUF397 domain-containing protein n=1 Tax=Streptomyces gamaensis TaxID=1763542 RepID=A0ABW0ZCS4_9ACTN